MRKSLLLGLTLAGAAVLLAPVGAARADSVEDFYRGKTLRMLIGYGPGGGYDLYGRLVAEFLPKFLPGKPTMIPQNMPGGGSFVAAKYMSEVAPKDGTVFGSLSQTLALDSVTNNSAKIDVSKFAYIGRVVSNIDVGVTLPKSGIKSFDDVRKKEYTVGASGGGSTTVLYPAALNAYAGSKFKIVRGYSGTNTIQLAMERGEVDILSAYGLPGILVSQPNWINKGEATFLYQAALKRHPLIPDVPTMPELATSDDGRVVLQAIASTAEIGRSINTTPGIPADRLAALRKAFEAMVKDPDFLAACEQRHLMIDPAPGEDMDAIVQQTIKLPSDVVQNIAKMNE